MKLLSCVLTLAGLLLGSSWAAPPSTLRLVSIVYRHGDRSPAKIYPKDINQVDSWPDGLGWLTNIGKQQQFELGQFVKQRYDGFIDTSKYNHNEIAIESSAVNRCLMSAYSHLAGLFPPGGDQVWNPELKWQPIPVLTRPPSEDNKLALQKECPKYDQLFKELIESPAIQEEEKENKEFFEMVEKNTGVKKESLEDIWEVADALICEKAHRMKWNDWVNKEGVWEKMQQVRTASFDLLNNNSAMARLRGGPLLKEIIANMKAATKTEKPMPKFYMYSAHDSTVVALLSALHAYNHRAPIYRALIMVELHEIDSEFVVKVFYRNDTTVDPYQVTPKGCSESCTLSELIEVTHDTVPDDWDKECEVKSSKPGSLSPASYIAAGIAIGLCLMFVLALLIWFVNFRKKNDSPAYARLNP